MQFYSPDRLAGYTDTRDYVALHEGRPVAGARGYRLLTPALAALVPEAPLRRLTTQREVRPEWLAAVRFSLVNAAFLVLTAAALQRLMLGLGFAFPAALLGTLLFFTAHPVVQSGSFPMVDAGSWCALAVGAMLVLERRALLLALAFAVGMFAKETLVLLLPLTVLAPTSWRERARLLAATVPGLAAYLAFRFWISPDPAESYSRLSDLASHPSMPLGWVASVGTSPARLVDLLASFGLLWVPAIAALRRRDTPAVLRRWALLVPILLALIVLAYWNLGRVLFYAFPVVIPLAVLGLERWWRDAAGSATRGTREG